MINFFRKIRQNLLSEGKTGKYIKYALGEIFLVMIGILLALQVNNWNEKRKSNTLKEAYIENLIADLNTDLENLDQLNFINTHNEKEGRYLAEFLDNRLTEPDTLRLTYAIISTGFIPNITIISSTYDDLINSNNIHLFNDVQIKKLLDGYYIPDNWVKLFNDRILQTAWYDYRDEMLKFHSPLLYKDFYAGDQSINANYSRKYDIKWDLMKGNDYLRTQIGMLEAFRIPIRKNIEDHIIKAKTLLSYLNKLK
ncbi:DUF6090 family protein [Robiginitalea sp. IMCC44478]|uniref:DUF6090 family protein n=1 Tax=Robiginitalea sp. IMCC44478 TaxID=3459122 RepID=UPI0040434166